MLKMLRIIARSGLRSEPLPLQHQRPAASVLPARHRHWPIPGACPTECFGHNAPTQSWVNSFNNEQVQGWRFATREQMTATAFE